MKMGIFFGNLFWGVLLVLLGTSIILKGFGLSIPLVKIFLAILIIMFGVKLLIGGSKRSKLEHVRKYETGKRVEYSSVFASQNIDLTHVKPGDKPIEITCVFGSSIVKIPDGVAFTINPTTVFGATIMPGNKYFGFGDEHVSLNDAAMGEKVYIEANCIFGRLEFEIVKSPKPINTSAGDSTATVGEGF